ncbi:pentapeptide repeat-containing protein [Streptomyces sp. NPDC012486]|uniref:pentapeptide repeat-containing protein n=1 Tax=Streptomyces sp. NPDC012486 TaxID=3156669 RepID=UPI00340A39DE
MDDADRGAYLQSLTAGSELLHPGTTITSELLAELLDAVRDPTSGMPRSQHVWFTEATFVDDSNFGDAAFDLANFEGATFNGAAQFGEEAFKGFAGFKQATFNRDVLFLGTRFHGGASFSEVTFNAGAYFAEVAFPQVARFGAATFNGSAIFAGVIFTSVASFSGVTFTSDALFDDVTFHNEVLFDGVAFNGDAQFHGVTFTGPARYSEATFTNDALFDEATFNSAALFDEVTFNGDAQFDRATFKGDAQFSEAAFNRDAQFNETTLTGGGVLFREATFAGDIGLRRAAFDKVPHIGPLVCSGQITLDGAVFQQPVTVQIAAAKLSCVRTMWASAAALHLRYAELDLRDAVLEFPLTIAAHPRPFPSTRAGGDLIETGLSSRGPIVRLVSVSGVDAAHLVMQDIGLSVCQLFGAVHLDQLKVDGGCTFATSPDGWSRRYPWRWSRRSTLAEESHWRVRAARSPARARGWTVPPEAASKLEPAAVAVLYRQLRKSLEDGKNEPDAADFYYGECEMRRHDKTRPTGERWLLRAYWAVSGYGLRATRALVWLGAAMGITVAALMLWGLPNSEPKQEASGTVPTGGGAVTFEIDKGDPQNPTGDRVTGKRFEKALDVTLNSVIFRSSGQDLTTAGTYIEMGSRLAEPILLGLAVLAVRNRVKR